MTCEQFIAALSQSATLGAAAPRSARAPQAAPFFTPSAEGTSGAPMLAEHAAGCAQCRALWQADQRLSAVLKQRQEVSELPPALRQLLTEQAVTRRGVRFHARSRFSMFFRSRASTRASTRWSRLVAVLVGCVTCLAFAVVFVPRPDLRSAFAEAPLRAFGVLAFVWLGTLLTFLYRGRSGLGAPPWWRWLGVALGLLAFHALVALSAHLPVPIAGSFVPPRDCLLLGLCAGLVVGAVVLAVSRHTALIAPAASGALAGCAAGYAGLLFLHVHCPAQGGLHLHVVHGLPLLLLIAIGALWGRRLLSA